MTLEQLARYKSYLQQDPHNMQLLLKLCDAYMQREDYHSAKNYFEQAQQIDANQVWFQQGLFYMHEQQINLAIKAFIHALDYNDTPLGRYNLAYCLYCTKQFKQALDVLACSADNYSSWVETHLLKARILHHLNHIPQAITLLNHCLSHMPNHSECLGVLSLLYYDQGEAKQAEYYSKKALAIQNNHYEANVVQLLLKVKKQKIPIDTIQTMLDINPTDCRLWFILGTTFFQETNFLAALQAFTQACTIWPSFYECWLSLGWCYLFLGQEQQASSAFQQATSCYAEQT